MLLQKYEIGQLQFSQLILFML